LTTLNHCATFLYCYDIIVASGNVTTQNAVDSPWQATIIHAPAFSGSA